MKTSTKLVIGLVIVALVGFGFAFFGKSDNQVVAGASGTDHYNYENFFNGVYGKQFTQGGGVKSFTATSTQSAYTLTQSDLATNHLIFINATNSPALTMTLPASSTLTTFAKNSGDDVEFEFYNAQTGAATTTIISGGTGTTLNNASTTCTIAAAKSAIVRLVRLPNTNFFASCGVQSY